MTLRLGWFATGRGSTSPKLLAAAQEEIAAGRLDAQIAVVFCNRRPGEDPSTDAFLDLVTGYGLPLVTLSSRDFRRDRGGEVARKGAALPDWRREYDRDMMRLLEAHPFDIGILAGYMLIFTDEAARRYDLLNLHPAAPGGPKGMWQDVIWELIERKAEQAGVMMHLATPELDEGPVVTYCTYPIRGHGFDSLWRQIEGRPVGDVRSQEGESLPLFSEIRRHGVARELPLVIETLRAFADGRLRVTDKRVIDSQGHVTSGYDLTADIERAVSSTLA